MNIHHIKGFYNIAEAAKRKRVQPRTIREHIKLGKISWQDVDGFRLIQLNTLPQTPVPEGVYKTDLQWVNRCAEKNGIIPERIYEQIIFGNIGAVLIADRIFVSKIDPKLVEYLKTAKKR